MLSQNHSWNGLTRPARINDNLPPAAAGSPEQRCRVDPQPGTLAALRTRPGQERGAPRAARWVCGDPARAAGNGGPAWGGGAAEGGRGELLAVPQGPPWPRAWAPTCAMGVAATAALSNLRRGSRACRGHRAAAPGTPRGRVPPRRDAGESLEVCRATLLACSVPEGRGQPLVAGRGGSEARGPLRKGVADRRGSFKFPPSKKARASRVSDAKLGGGGRGTKAKATRGTSRGPDRGRNQKGGLAEVAGQAGEGRVAILGRERAAEPGGLGTLPCAPTRAGWAGRLPHLPTPWSPSWVSKLPEPPGAAWRRERSGPVRPHPCRRPRAAPSGAPGSLRWARGTWKTPRKEPSAEHPE